MKQKFSTAWKSSRQTRKQRKYFENAPLHIKYKFLSANLSKELRKKHGRNIEARKGDSVIIMRGKFRKKKGKISKVDLKRTRIAIEGIQRQKKDGTKVNVYFHPSKIQIIELVERKIKQNKEKQNAPEKKPSA
ncbi:50S ribosomal protein L24 [Candidatus Pacearchaeota archaeon]|nr:50S ribosomal protein L24 [Candidatus Pacearchaeota archaeon]